MYLFVKRWKIGFILGFIGKKEIESTPKDSTRVFPTKVSTFYRKIAKHPLNVQKSKRPGAPGQTINAFFQKQPALLCIVPRMVPSIVTLSATRSYHVFTYSWKSLYTFATYRANWTDWTASMLDLTGNFSLIYFRKQGSSFHVCNKFSGCNVRRDRSLQQRQHHRMRL